GRRSGGRRSEWVRRRQGSWRRRVRRGAAGRRRGGSPRPGPGHHGRRRTRRRRTGRRSTGPTRRRSASWRGRDDPARCARGRRRTGTETWACPSGVWWEGGWWPRVAGRRGAVNIRHPRRNKGWGGSAGPGLGPLVDLADLLGELLVALLVQLAVEAPQVGVRAAWPARKFVLR